MQQLIHNFFNWQALQVSLPFLVSGLTMTLGLSAASMICGLAIGLLTAGLGQMNHRIINWLLVAYVDVLRATPPIVLIIFVYYGLPYVGVQLPAFAAAIASFALYAGSYNAEIIRSSIEAIQIGQYHAARSLGMSHVQTMRHVVLPQAFRIAIPPLTNQAVALVRLTSVAFVVAIPELLNMSRWAQGLTANSTPLLAGAVVYLVVLLILSRVTASIEFRLQHQSPRGRA